MTLPKIGTATNDKLGVSIVSEVVFRTRSEGGLGFVYRNQPDVDVGIDGHIEVVDQATNEATGKFVGVQVKAGPSYFRHRTPTGWTLHIKKSSVRYWRQYAVPVVLALVNPSKSVAYWVLVSEGDFEETARSFKIHVSKDHVLDATAAEALTELATLASTALAGELGTLKSEWSDSTSRELDSARVDWREGRRGRVRDWVERLVSTPARLAAIDPVVASRVLRFAAAIVLDETGATERARGFVEQAKRLDPEGDDLRLRAALLTHGGDHDAAIDLLAAAIEPGAQIMRASILCSAGRRVEAGRVLDGCDPTDAVDASDACRIRARLCLGERDLAGALVAAEEAERHAPRHVAVRYLCAALTYLNGLLPEGLPDDLPQWPQPVPEEFIRRDGEAVASFTAAVDAFRQLLTLDWEIRERRQVEAWLMASLMAAQPESAGAVAFAQEVLARDASHPFVILWAASLGLPMDLGSNLDALRAEAETTEIVEPALAYVGACHGIGETAGLGGWMDTWRERFRKVESEPVWAFWRGRVYLAAGDIPGARALLSETDPALARVLEAEIIGIDSRRTDDSTALIAYLDACGRETGDPQFLLKACLERAREGKWDEVLPRVEPLLDRFPAGTVRRLAIHARYHMGDLAGCDDLLEQSLREGATPDRSELQRLRASVRLRTGDVVGAIADMESLVAGAPGRPPTSDLLFLARAYLVSGHTHELAVRARQLRRHDDLEASDALMICQALVHDDPPLAREYWRRASELGVLDSDVSSAVLLGFQLGLDEKLAGLRGRMIALAASGDAGIQQFTLDELLDRQRDWLTQRDRVLELYRRGGTATHMVADFLNEPLVHLFHDLLTANEAQPSLRHSFPLQLRSGARSLSSSSDRIAASGRLALDLSALLLCAHLGVLAEVEEEFGPLLLPHLAVVSLREQRDRLRHHQPSRIEDTRTLLAAERQGRLRTWEGDLPALDTGLRESAQHWWQWVALLERARIEDAFVLDLPLEAESALGRPATIAGAERISRIITVSEVTDILVQEGQLDARGTRSPVPAETSDTRVREPLKSAWMAATPTEVVLFQNPADGQAASLL